MELLQDCSENPVVLLLYSSIGFLWDSVGLLRDFYTWDCSVAMGLLWDSYGIAADIVLGLPCYCCSVAVG